MKNVYLKEVTSLTWDSVMSKYFYAEIKQLFSITKKPSYQFLIFFETSLQWSFKFYNLIVNSFTKFLPYYIIGLGI